MGGRSRTVISIETHQLTVVRARRRPVSAWCEQCGMEVQMLTPEQAALIAGASARAIYRRAEAAELHFIETMRESLLICSRSLRLKE